MSTEPGQETVDEATLRVLSDPALILPKIRHAEDMTMFLEREFAEFERMIAQLGGRLGDLMKQGEYYRRDLELSLAAVPELIKKKRESRAWTVFEDAVDEHLGTLSRMSLRHSHKVLSSRSWYRLSTWNGVKSRRDMFHIPFEKPSGSYRYSPRGKPALYLGNNVYVCWAECRNPELDKCYVARFEITAAEKFLDLPANHDVYLNPLRIAQMGQRFPTSPLFSPFRADNSPYLLDVTAELAEYLSIWPLLIACSVQKENESTEEIPEYLISQLLMRWVEKRRDLGIRYFTTRADSSNNSNDISINVVLPARVVKKQGYCDFLMERALCTVPQRFTDPDKVPDQELFTLEAADQIESLRGRYWVNWQGQLQHYQYTPFGRMEYWLHRPTFPVGRIDLAT